jgi:hypothetical protein
MLLLPVKIFLNSETKNKLQKALKEHEHPDIPERVLIFLLLDDGSTHKRIVELIRCSRSKVACHPFRHFIHQFRCRSNNVLTNF